MTFQWNAYWRLMRFDKPIGILLLLWVEWFGKYVGGSRRWLEIGPASLQPSELVKLGVIIILARYYAKMVNTRGLSLRELIRPMILTGCGEYLY